MLGWLLFRLGLHRRLLAGRAVVVAFHRVEDRYSDNPISCTRAEFAAYLKFFRRYFTVISLTELLRRLERGDDLNGHCVITFDDGYLDNYRDAAPELARHRLPACFFIPTEFIGSDRVAWWDQELGVRSEFMTWDDVRSLRTQGFEIGAHTMNHVDLGVLGGDAAMAEIVGSKKRLERELDMPIDLFAYPYGRQNQLSEENRRAVAGAGFSCCLSSFGGLVTKGDDPYRITRMPISPWYVSPCHFGFEVLFSAL